MRKKRRERGEKQRDREESERERHGDRDRIIGNPDAITSHQLTTSFASDLRLNLDSFQQYQILEQG